MASDRIVVRGAREHNLKTIDVEIPRDQLVVITGLSGSGKSSLAFDTIYAEGQRRYVESLSAYARQFLEQMEKPDVDSIEGLSPAISIEQKTTSKNPRSTVGTVTEIYDYLRLLFARVGVAALPPVRQRDRRADRPADGRPRPDAARGQPHRPARAGGARAQGRVPQAVLRPAAPGLRARARRRRAPRADRGDRARQDQEAHDRGRRRPPGRSRTRLGTRLADSLETALRLAEGVVQVEVADGASFLFSERLACARLRHLLPGGLAADVLLQQPVRRVPGVRRPRHAQRDRPRRWSCRIPRASLGAGALAPWAGPQAAGIFKQTLRVLAKRHKFSLETPWTQAAEEDARDHPLRRGGRRLRGRARRCSTAATGRPLSEDARARGRAVHGARACPACSGSRLRAGDAVGQDRGPVDRRGRALSRSRTRGSSSTTLALTEREKAIARRVLKEIRERLGFLSQVGLDYLTLDRPAGHAVGRRGAAHPPGDPDRLEPGRRALHPGRAVDRPAPARQRPPPRHAAAPARPRQHGARRRARRGDDPRRRLRRRPRARARASTAGTSWRRARPTRSWPIPPSLTGQYLSRRSGDRGARDAARRPTGKIARRSTTRASTTSRAMTVRIPLGTFTCVTGVSGSGKSTLVNDILYRALASDAATARRSGRARTTASRGSSTSTRSSTSTSRRSAARRARTRRPTPASSRSSATLFARTSRRPRARLRSRAASRSTSRAGGARRARATGS